MKIGFFGLLGILLIAFKLAAVGVVASWSWWLVLSPFWAPVVLLVVGGFCYLCIVGKRS